MSDSTGNYVQRAISISFALGVGTFGAENSEPQNTTTVSGLRTSVRITQAGLMPPTADIRIYGMPLTLMNKLSLLGKLPWQTAWNTVTVMAGSVGGAMPVVYVGNIQRAFPDMNSMPDTSFFVQAIPKYLQAIPPTSYAAPVDVATVMQGLATKLNLQVENNLTQPVMIPTPYYPFDAWTQILTCARAANINVTIENNTLVLWPHGGARDVAHPLTIAPLVSPSTGLVGYPRCEQDGISFTTIYNPNILCNAVLKLESSLAGASGNWKPLNLEHNLESLTPGGAWFTTVNCTIWGKPAAALAGV